MKVQLVRFANTQFAGKPAYIEVNVEGWKLTKRLERQLVKDIHDTVRQFAEDFKDVL
jgi:hypothetical protein